MFSGCACAEKSHGLILVGLDAAGKTTWLYRLQTGENVSTNPTIVSNFEEIRYKNVKLSVWDLGGQAAHRPLWKYHFQGTKGLLFAVDSSDRQRIHEARRELLELLKDERLQGAIVIVLANKQDIPNAMSAQEIADSLGLSTAVGSKRKWFVQPTSAIYGEGINEAMDWLLANLGLDSKGSANVNAGHDALHYPRSQLKIAEAWQAKQGEQEPPAHSVMDSNGYSDESSTQNLLDGTPRAEASDLTTSSIPPPHTDVDEAEGKKAAERHTETEIKDAAVRSVGEEEVDKARRQPMSVQDERSRDVIQEKHSDLADLNLELENDHASEGIKTPGEETQHHHTSQEPVTSSGPFGPPQHVVKESNQDGSIPSQAQLTATRTRNDPESSARPSRNRPSQAQLFALVMRSRVPANLRTELYHKINRGQISTLEELGAHGVKVDMEAPSQCLSERRGKEAVKELADGGERTIQASREAHRHGGGHHSIDDQPRGM